MGNWNGDNSVNTQTLLSSHSQMHLLSGGKQTLGRGEDKCMCIHWLLKDNFSKLKYLLFMRQQHFEEAGIKKCQKHMYKIVYILSDDDQAASNAEVV